MISRTTTSPAGTRAVAAAVAAVLRPGDVLVLVGEMGAGKTAFTQGLAAALGHDGPVTSPTFTLVHTYDGGRLRLHHVDVYRLERPSELHDLGLAELLDDDAVTAVEWGDAIRAALPAEALEIVLRPGAGPDDRTIELRVAGPSWAARRAALAAAVEAASC